MLNFDQCPCPRCGEDAKADFVDNGVGMQQVGPFGCEACGWAEQPPYLSNEEITLDNLVDEEISF